jgi:hypothetical protein
MKILTYICIVLTNKNGNRGKRNKNQQRKI